jgi:hypothetical protein
MYAYPTLLKQVSNREDLLQTIQIFDDDTGDPVKLDGCTTASGAPFTGNAWTVTDGTIITTSSTVLMIPVFPIALNAALQLTVGVNLSIVPGDPLTIADTPTGQNFMTGYVISYNPGTGILICQIGMIFRFEIRRLGPSYRATGDAYVPWYDLGTQGEDSPLITATLGQGISIIDIGTLQVRIPATVFQRLLGGTYSAALVFSDSVDTRQVYIGSLPVIPGRLSPLPLAWNAGPLWN